MRVLEKILLNIKLTRRINELLMIIYANRSTYMGQEQINVLNILNNDAVFRSK